MIPLWAMALLRKAEPYLFGATALLAAATAIHFWNVHERGIGRAETQAKWDAETKQRGDITAAMNGAIVTALTPKFEALALRISDIGARATAINVKMAPAIASDPRYRDAKCALTAPVLESVNAARALSGEAK